MSTNTVKAAVYLRMSVEKELGIARQREDCLKLCQAKGWTPVEFIDDGVSASTGKRRPGYEDMLAAIRDGSVQAVVVWDLDRLFRRPVELEAFMDVADGHQLKLASVSGDVDLSTAQGRLVARLKGAVARHEVEHKVARQKRAARQKAEAGRPQWRRAFGYVPDTRAKADDDGTRQVDERQAQLVKQAYHDLLTGDVRSITAIAERWNAAKAYNHAGVPWTPSTVSQFLRKPRNCALREYDGEIVGPGTWPGLVDEATWRAVQLKLDAPTAGLYRRGRRPGAKSVRKHPLTGVLLCGREGCNGTLSGNWVMQKTGGKSGRPKAGQKKEPHSGQTAHSITYACKTCRGVSIRAEHVTPLLYGLVAERLGRDDAKDLLKAEAIDLAEAEAIRAERHILLGRKDEIAAERADGLIDGHGYRAMIERLDAQLAALDDRENDGEKSRALHGLRLGEGTEAAAESIEPLSADRFRTVLSVLATVSVMGVGKGGHRFDKDRLVVDWH
ncbi:recombinase family protein [Mycobacterium avium]|uniref:recombinase family protein n=1 Tax=Mycobacterium avium TaxID=1764 RepID=UPI0009BD7FA4|nr:recombinase family protein [Mycobacterium avium]